MGDLAYLRAPTDQPAWKKSVTQPFPIIETQRLILHGMRNSDLGLFSAMNGNAAAKFNRMGAFILHGAARILARWQERAE